jgi:hypothetical protein
VSAAVPDVALHLTHAVRHIESAVPPLVHRHDMLGDLAIDHFIGLIDHHVQKIKSASDNGLERMWTVWIGLNVEGFLFTSFFFFLAVG